MVKRSGNIYRWFHNFSTQEYQVIEALVRHTRAVTVLLTTNGDEDSFSMFRKPSESLQHLEEIAQDTHQPLQRHFSISRCDLKRTC
nr:hypothetical protein [Staphylococcus aureus]